MEIYRKNTVPQKRDPHLCAVEMHFDISQEPLLTEIYKKIPHPRMSRAQNADTHFVRACAIEMHFDISQGPLDTEIYRKNAASQNEPKTQTHTLCGPAQLRRMARFHRRHLIWKFAGKMPRPRVSTLIKHRTLHPLQEPLSADTLFVGKSMRQIWHQ